MNNTKTFERRSPITTTLRKLTLLLVLLLSSGVVFTQTNSSQRRPELSVVVGHSVSISALAFRSDEQILASGDDNGAIKLWDVKTGEGLSVITEAGSDLSVNTPAIGSLAFSSDGKLLAAAMVVTQEIKEAPFHKSQTQIGIWDLASGRPVRSLSGLDIRV